ncbi:hypothetical protein AB0C10_36500 [Microbispora amethystogenes]|uniref:hypothetical protein n=1 Tax=Microbispora amethystogenes TaxID=1427754 RepID=UPI0033F27841
MNPGDYVRPPGVTAFYHDDTSLVQLSNTGYDTGSPEVGVFFIAPPSGRVRVTIGGGLRDNGAAPFDRVFLSPQLFLDNSSGSVVINPADVLYDLSTAKENNEFQYGSRVVLVQGLAPGNQYYLRVMHSTSPGTDPDTADIASRDIIVIPVP